MITPEGFNFMVSVQIVVIVILGGMGNTVGVIIAAILLTLLPELLRMMAGSQWLVETTRFFASSLPPEGEAKAVSRVQELFSNRNIFFSLILIVVMLLRPHGIFTRSRKAVTQ